MRNWLKTIFFLSAFSPALVSIAIVRWLKNGLSEDVIYYAVSGIVGAAVSLFIIKLIERHGEIITLTAKKIEANDSLMLGVFASYAIPFMNMASDINFTVVFSIFFAIAVLLWYSSSLPPHPLMRILQYRFYKVESDRGMVYTLIARRELVDPKNITKVRRISSSMLLEVQ